MGHKGGISLEEAGGKHHRANAYLEDLIVAAYDSKYQVGAAALGCYRTIWKPKCKPADYLRHWRAAARSEFECAKERCCVGNLENEAEFNSQTGLNGAAEGSENKIGATYLYGPAASADQYACPEVRPGANALAGDDRPCLAEPGFGPK